MCERRRHRASRQLAADVLLRAGVTADISTEPSLVRATDIPSSSARRRSCARDTGWAPRKTHARHHRRPAECRDGLTCTRILVIGSGPIIIGQAAEFDYSGTQATKALKEEGYEVILINSNPATIMTDPEFADRTYIEPVTPEFVELILEREKPDAILPTMGGQTALNVAMALVGVAARSRSTASS